MGTSHAINDIAKQAPMRNLKYPPLPQRGGKPWTPPTPIRAAALQVSPRHKSRPVPQPKAPPRSLQQRRDKEQIEAPPTKAIKRTLHTSARHTKMLRAPKPARPSGAIHTAAEIQDKLRQQCVQDWIAILNHLGTESQLAIAMHNSSHGDTLARIAIQCYSPNTLSQYIRAIRIFLRGAVHHETPPSHFTLALMVDLLHECKEGSQQDRGVHKCTPALMIRAIGWLARHAQIQNLPALMSNPLIQAFGKPEGPRDRREALPLPLSTIAAWEAKIREPSTPHALKILLGAMLVAAHASVRFADMQRIRHSSLGLAGSGLRGNCWATKTSSTGQPWAVAPFGLTARETPDSWIVHWLRALKQAHLATEEELGTEVDPDFLLPCLPPLHSAEPAIFAEPMSYQQALHAMRWAMTLPWEANQIPALPEEAAAFTLHSLKTSLLSAANQLRLPEEDRPSPQRYSIAMVGSTRHCPEWRCLTPTWLQRAMTLFRMPTLHRPVRALSPTVSPCSVQYVRCFSPCFVSFTGSSATDGS